MQKKIIKSTSHVYFNMWTGKDYETATSVMTFLLITHQDNVNY